MRELSDPRLIKLKGILFVFLGIASSALCILECR